MIGWGVPPRLVEALKLDYLGLKVSRHLLVTADMRKLKLDYLGLKDQPSSDDPSDISIVKTRLFRVESRTDSPAMFLYNPSLKLDYLGLKV